MDFMQCINFKSRLDREREMIRRKIRSSTLYRKPSFSKSAFNIYNVNGEMTKVSCVTKNLKITEFKDEPIRKSKSPLLVNDEQEDECTNEEKSILCIGSKYLDLTSNLMAPPLIKSVSASTINLNSHDLSVDKQQEVDFERAISQSHLSPSSPSIMVNGNHVTSSKKALSDISIQETMKKPKTANSHNNSINTNNINTNDSNNKTVLSLNSDNDKTSENEEDESTENKRNDHNNFKNHSNNNPHNTSKIFKKNAQTVYCGAVGHNVGKYSDAQKTEVTLDDLSNSIVEQSNNLNTKYDIINNLISNNNKISPSNSNTTHAVTTNSAKTAKKSAATMTRKKPKRSDTMKCDSVKSSATRKSESSQLT